MVPDMKIGIASSVFVNYSIEKTIELVAEAGYDGIDIWGGRPHVYRNDCDEKRLNEIRKLLSENNLRVASHMPAFFRYPHSLSNPNEVVRQDSIDYMRQCINNAVVLDAEIVLIVPGRSLFGQNLEDARSRLIDSIDQVCTWAQHYNLRLGIEPANRMVTDLVVTSDDALEIINELSYPNLGVVMDTGHLHLTGEAPEQAIKNLGDRLFQFHVNDNDGLNQQNLVPGEGTFDFPAFLRLLEAAGYDGFLSAELGWHYTLDPVPEAHATLTRMKEYLS
jgi:protein FrlC